MSGNADIPAMSANADIDPHADCICNHTDGAYWRDGRLRSIFADGQEFLPRDELIREATEAILALTPNFDINNPDSFWLYRPRVLNALRSLRHDDNTGATTLGRKDS